MVKKQGIHIFRVDENGTPDYEFIARDTCPSLEEFYEIIGCRLIEIVVLPDGRDMVCDEEGLLVSDPVRNFVASSLAGQPIVGNVVLLEGLKVP